MATVEQVLQQIWTNDATKRKLQADPKAFLKDVGVTLPPNVKVQLHEDSLSVKNFVLPEGIKGDAPASQDPVVNVIVKAIKDPAFKAKLLANPKATVRDMGVAVPDAIDVRVFQNTPDTLHLVLPSNPKDAELSDADLEAVAGGMSKSNQTAVGCGAASGALGVGAIAANAIDFTAIGLALPIGLGVGAVATGAASTGASVGVNVHKGK